MVEIKCQFELRNHRVETFMVYFKLCKKFQVNIIKAKKYKEISISNNLWANGLESFTMNLEEFSAVYTDLSFFYMKEKTRYIFENCRYICTPTRHSFLKHVFCPDPVPLSLKMMLNWDKWKHCIYLAAVANINVIR